MGQWQSQVGAVKAGIKDLTDEVSGTLSYLDVGGEQDIFVYTPAGRVVLHGVFLDCVNMTQNGTIKLYFKIDGTTYRQFDDDTFLVAEQDGIYIDLGSMAIDDDFKVTYEEAADEGAARDLPYKMIYQERE